MKEINYTPDNEHSLPLLGWLKVQQRHTLSQSVSVNIFCESFTMKSPPL